MLLRDVSLFLNIDEYGGDYSSDFQFRSRYVCNFVRRQIVPVRFKTGGFGSIVVEGCREPTNECPIRGEKVLSATVAFDQQEYESLAQGEHHEFFIGMLLEGLEKCSQHHEIPLKELQSAIEEFRSGGYKNEWVHQSKLLRGSGLRGILLCKMDSERFTLYLRLERKGKVVFEEQILETEPDETIFAHEFKEVVLKNNKIVVEDKFGDPTFSMSLDTLCN